MKFLAYLLVLAAVSVAAPAAFAEDKKTDCVSADHGESGCLAMPVAFTADAVVLNAIAWTAPACDVLCTAAADVKTCATACKATEVGKKVCATDREGKTCKASCDYDDSQHVAIENLAAPRTRKWRQMFGAQFTPCNPAIRLRLSQTSILHPPSIC